MGENEMTGLTSHDGFGMVGALAALADSVSAPYANWLPLTLSAACGAAAILVYLWLGRCELQIGRRRARHSLAVGAGVVLLLLVALARIWRVKLAWVETVDNWLLAHRVHGNILWSLVVLAAVYFLGRFTEHALLRSATDLEGRHKIRRAVTWGKAIAVFVCLAFIWGSGTQNLGLFFGILGAGVALSLQETLLCLAGCALIVIKKPFDVGDRIELAGQVGDVIDIRAFQTSLLEVGNWVAADQSTGRIINVPNSAVFRGLSANYTKGFPFIWNEQTIVVTFESDWKRAKEIILKQAQEEAEKIEGEVRKQIEQMRQHYAIRYDRLSPMVYTQIGEHGVALTLRYLCPVRKRRGTTHMINEGVLEDLADEKQIHLAYPTTRFYDAMKENAPVD